MGYTTKIGIAYIIVGYLNKEDAKDFQFPYVLSADGKWLPCSYEQLKSDKRRHEAFSRIAYYTHPNAFMLAERDINRVLLAAHNLDRETGMGKIEIITPEFFFPEPFEKAIIKEIEELGLDVDEEFDKYREKESTWVDYKPYTDIEEICRRTSSIEVIRESDDVKYI